MRRRIATLAALLALSIVALSAHPVEAATVSGILPAYGSTAGGYNVTILGSGFSPSSTVYFGGLPSPSVSWLDSGIISVTVPPGTGTVLVTILSPDGTTSAGQPFTYTASGNTTLSVNSVSPNIGASGGGTTVTIVGNGFLSGVTVLFGGLPATNTSLLSSTLITATAPAGPLGGAPIVVTNPGGQSVVYTGFSYGTTSSSTMTVTSVSPTSVPIGGGTSILINGSGFLSGVTVTFGGIVSPNPIFYSSTLIGATAPSGPIGTVSIVVTNITGESAVYGAFTYGTPTSTTTSAGQPSVQSVTPNSGSSAGGISVTINGSGFTAPATVTFGGVPASNISVVNANLITATTPPNAVGPVTVLVGSSTGQVGGLTGGFTYIVAVPLVSGVSPASGLPQGGTPITITGSGFVPGATVTVGGVTATAVTVVSPTQITATTPAGPAGSAIILVINPGGAISGLASAFSYSSTAVVSPTTSVTSVSPSTGPASGGTSVSIFGSGFASGATVTIGGNVASATVLSSTQIVATTPATATAGAASVTVSNAGGTSATLASAFVYTSSTSTTPPPTGGGSTTPAVPAGGSGLFVFRGGSNADLVAASGCNAATAVFWTTDSHGAWIGYLPSVPIAIVNQAWNSLFPNGIPANTPIFARCG